MAISLLLPSFFVLFAFVLDTGEAVMAIVVAIGAVAVVVVGAVMAVVVGAVMAVVVGAVMAGMAAARPERLK